MYVNDRNKLSTISKSIKRNANLKQSKMLNYDSFSVSYNDIVIITKGGRVKLSELQTTAKDFKTGKSH